MSQEHKGSYVLGHNDEGDWMFA